jgi:hypothetical protein
MMGIKQRWNTMLFKPVSIAPLVTFRMLFGAIMFISVMRFWSNGWIESQFIEPLIHFKYFGFYWVADLPDMAYYFVFGLMALSSLGIAFGAMYRLSSILFFLSFTYIELIDVTYYLNHYYFVSLVSLVMIFLPANASRSLDQHLGFIKLRSTVSAWTIDVLKFQLVLVYVFAGIAKLNADWLIHAMPLAIWLPAQDQLPVLGSIFKWEATPYIFSWAGALYDLFVPVFLLIARTRIIAYVAVIVFHLMTWSLFQIGMFPFIMIGATLVFFSAAFHENWQQRLFGALVQSLESATIKPNVFASVSLTLLVLFQLAFPFRHLAYDGNPFWHEQGYRFGWRVMLMEKAGYAQFSVENEAGNRIEVQNSEFLTRAQEKMMSTQPDLMIQYAQFLEAHYEKAGVLTRGVYANVHVTFNGRDSRPYVDPLVNLAAQADSWEPKTWILPFES